VQGPAISQHVEDPDALYAQRQNPSSARRAVELWSDELARHPDDFETAWKLARGRYWLGEHGPEADRKRELERGIEAARVAIKLQPNRPDGHFWLAANMGALAESHGIRAGLKYRKPIKEALETVLGIDPGYQQGSADRALGRWYYKVPRLFGGSNQKSEQHLRKSLTYAPNSTVSHFFLAETLLDEDRKAEARAELEKVLELPLDPQWAPEDEYWKQEARTLLTKLGRS
jgi:tetratricopeptide (TPR) repeat protein